jgi:hypothetical protein
MVASQKAILERNEIAMKAIEIRNNEALEKQSACGINEKVRMSKKRRARIDKIHRDSSLSKFEKER